MALIRSKRVRRITGLALVVMGGLLLWLAPEVTAGVVLLCAGLILEIVGIALERREGR
jgi:hypothetical protein